MSGQASGREKGRGLRLASTVVVMRDHDRGDGRPRLEVLLMRRHRGSAFMGGAYVFPGGALDPEDQGPAWRDRAGAGAWERLTTSLEPTGATALPDATARGLGVAAVRELFEEAGLLLARTPDGAAVRLEGADEARWAAHRARLNAGEVGFDEVLDAEGVTLDLEALRYWAHWITPSHETRRFDARFFLARIPEGQTALVDAAEMIDQVWRTPDEALAAAAEGRMVLPPPTVRTLEELVALEGAEAALTAAKGRSVVPVLPKIVPHEETLAVLLPWDPQYAEAEGEGLSVPSGHPFTLRPSRLVLEGARWVSRSPA